MTNQLNRDLKSKPKNKKVAAKEKVKKSVSHVDIQLDLKKYESTGLHKNNRHRGRYDFKQLVENLPELQAYMINNVQGDLSINFSDPQAVKALNKALLKTFYGITYWDIPDQYLCPPIPGRADYIHRVVGLLDKKHLQSQQVKALDIGVGANSIYPIIGATQYSLQYVGSDIDAGALKSAQKIIDNNEPLQGLIELRHQTQSSIFKGIILDNEFYDITTCNPPFHRSAEEAQQGSQRKVANLNKNQHKRRTKNTAQHNQTNRPLNQDAALNFGGRNHELWCPGGEISFIKQMAQESADYQQQVLWFSTLISKKENVRPMRKSLEQLGVKAIRIVAMKQGQKVSRFIAWSYLDESQRLQWVNTQLKSQAASN